MTHDEIMNLLNREYAERRAADQAAFEARQDEACEKCPGLRELLNERHALVMGGIRRSILSRGTEKEDVAGRMRELGGKIAGMLAQAGLPEDFLRPVYVCPLCKDEGYVYDPSRRMCGCMKKRLTLLLVEKSEFIREGHCFERFDESLFSGEKNESGVSPRTMARYCRKVCEDFADAWPDNEPKNLLLTGKSGLGKTYLLECVAHRLAERGVLPAYTTAYRYFEAARQAHIENDPAPLKGLMDADLLILDDLGTEPLMNNITVEQLFCLINERALAGRSTLISTNLSPNELRERYTERISSRLLDPSAWKLLGFIGEDVRQKAGRKA